MVRPEHEASLDTMPWLAPRSIMLHSVDGNIMVAILPTSRVQFHRRLERTMIDEKTCHEVGHDGWITCACMSRGRQLMLTGGSDGTVVLWDVVLRCKINHRDMRSPKGEPITSVAFSPCHERCVAVTTGGTVAVWEVRAGRPTQSSMLMSTPLTAVVWTADGRRILAGGADGRVRNYDSMHPRLLQTSTATTMVTSMCLLDGGRVLVGHSAGRISVMDTKTLKYVIAPSNDRPPAAVVLCTASQDGKLMMSGSSDGTFVLRDAETGVPTRGQFVGHLGRGRICGADFSPDSLSLVTTDGNNMARTWDVRKASPAELPPNSPRPPVGRRRTRSMTRAEGGPKAKRPKLNACASHARVVFDNRGSLRFDTRVEDMQLQELEEVVKTVVHGARGAHFAVFGSLPTELQANILSMAGPRAVMVMGTTSTSWQRAVTGADGLFRVYVHRYMGVPAWMRRWKDEKWHYRFRTLWKTYWTTPLHTLFRDMLLHGHVSAVEDLVRNRGCSLSDPVTPHGLSPIQLCAASNSSADVVPVLVRMGADLEQSICSAAGEDEMVQNALVLAVSRGSADSARALLEAGASPDPALDDMSDLYQLLYSPLFIACWRFKPEMVSLLIKFGANVRRRPMGFYVEKMLCTYNTGTKRHPRDIAYVERFVVLVVQALVDGGMRVCTGVWRSPSPGRSISSRVEIRQHGPNGRLVLDYYDPIPCRTRRPLMTLTFTRDGGRTHVSGGEEHPDDGY